MCQAADVPQAREPWTQADTHSIALTQLHCAHKVTQQNRAHSCELQMWAGSLTSAPLTIWKTAVASPQSGKGYMMRRARRKGRGLGMRTCMARGESLQPTDRGDSALGS